MSNAKQNIMIVNETGGLFPSRFREMLLEYFYVDTVRANIDAINSSKIPYCAIVIYADAKLMHEAQALNFIKDKAVMDDIPIFLVGSPKELAAIDVMIPRHLVHKVFERPASMTYAAMAETIDKAVKENDRQTRKKILVVDDDGDMLRTIKEWLGKRYSVYLVNSAAMAIKYLALNRPDLILLDYEMPHVDGKQVLEMIRNETEFYDIPVVFLTRKEDRESFLRVQPLKPEGYLLKSMLPGQIVNAVDDFFTNRKWG